MQPLLMLHFFAKKRKSMKSRIITNIIAFVFIVAIAANLLQYNVLTGDDMYLSFFRYEPFKELIMVNHGRYLSQYQIKFFGYILPSILNFHPNFITGTLSALVKSLNIACVCLFSGLFAYITRRKSFGLAALTLGIFYIYFFKLISENTDEISSLTYHFGYVGGLMMYLGFLFIISKLVITKTNFSSKMTAFASIFAFLAALNDTFAVTGIIFISFLYIVFSINEIMIEKSATNIKDVCKKYKSAFFICNTFLIGGLISICGMLYDNHMAVYFDDNFTINLDSIMNFLPQYFGATIGTRPILITIIVILSALILRRNSNGDRNTALTVWAMAVGLLGFFFSLLIGGDTTFYEQGKFWVWHRDLQLYLLIHLIAIFLLLYGKFVEKLPSKARFGLTTLFVLIAIFNVTTAKTFAQTYKETINTFKTEQYYAYKTEKMYLFYMTKNQHAYLPVSVLRQNNISSNFWNGIDNRDEIEIFDRYKTSTNQAEQEDLKNKIEKITFEKSFFRRLYIASIYKKDYEKIPQYSFSDDKDAYKKYIDNGGNLSNLEDKTINFNKLLKVGEQ